MAIRCKRIARARLLALLATATLLTGSEALGQDGESAFNWAYASGLGGDSGLSDNDYSDDGQKIQLIRITPGFWLRDLETESWGLQLLLPATIGVNERSFLDGAVEDSLTAFSIVPSLEAWIPAGPLVTFRPRAGIGWGQNLTSGDDAFILESGLKVDIEPRAGDWHFLVRPEFRYDLARSRSGRGDDDVGAVFITLDVLRPLPVQWGDYVPDASVYVQYGYFFEEALLGRPEGNPFTVDRQYEVGLTVGSEPRLKLWFVTMSRLQVGYRWGDGLSGIRIRLGSR